MPPPVAEATLLALAGCIAWAAAAAQTPPDVRHDDVQLEPDIARRSLQGQAVLWVALPPGITQLALDAGALQIDAVHEDNDAGLALPFTKTGERLTLQLTARSQDASAAASWGRPSSRTTRCAASLPTRGRPLAGLRQGCLGRAPAARTHGRQRLLARPAALQAALLGPGRHVARLPGRDAVGHQCRPGTVFDDWVYGSKR